MEKPDVAGALRLACQATPELQDVDPTGLTYYFRRETVIPSERAGGMARWRKALFAAMLLNANRSASYYGLPLAQVVEVVGVAVQHDEVAGEPGGQAADPGLQPEQPGGAAGRGRPHLLRGHPAPRHQRQLVEVAAVRTDTGVGAHRDQHAGVDGGRRVRR